MKTAEEVSSRGVEKCADRHKWQRNAPFASGIPWANWKKGLATLWSRERIAKTPTPVVGQNPYGKCQRKRLDHHFSAKFHVAAIMRTLLTFAFALLLGVSAVTPARAAAPDPQTIADAYVYLLGRMLVIRQEHTDLKEKGIDYNIIKYNPLGSADFVNPNLDVAYLEAWIAVDEQTPVILEIPKITDRYYTAQILDEWGEVIVNINERTFPSKPYGKFALVAPGSTAKIPADASRIELHSKKAKLLARVELKTDPDGAMALQKQFKLASTGKPRITPAATIPEFDNKSLIGADIFDHVDTVLFSALDVSPIAAEMQQKVRFVADYTKSSGDARAAVDKQLRDRAIPAFQQYALTKSAAYHNNWLGGVVPGGGIVGNFGGDYRLRTAANLLGIWANVPSEAQYFVASLDIGGKPLNGSNSYVIHFQAAQLPQSVVNSYWSIILVSVPDYRVVPNPRNRFNFNTYSPPEE
jgi:hypothetical protein